MTGKLDMYRVEFLSTGRTGYFVSGTSILEAARELDIELPSFCGGAGICGKCRVEVAKGISTPSAAEIEILSETDIASGLRLACEVRVEGSCVVNIPEPQRIETCAILTTGERGQVDIEPVISKRLLKVAKPSLENNPFDLEQLLEAAGLDLNSSHIPLELLRKIPSLLRKNDYQGTLVTADNRLVAFEPGDTTRQSYGIAVDVGTTTVVGKLLDLNDGTVLAVSSRLNSQRAFGEDVISRIGFAINHNDGLSRLHDHIIRILNDIVNELVAQADVPREHVYEAVCVGNTVMQHFLAKVDPRHLAEMPYVPVFRGPLWLPASELGMQINPFGFVYIMPHIGRYVGGDTVGVILSARLDSTKGVTLAVDIGTNGEVVLAKGDKLLACSTAAGPAFEGAHIKHGMRAAPGAIDHVLIRDDLYIHTINKAPACGICGSGLIDVVGELLHLGVIDESGRLLGQDELDVGVPTTIRKRIRPDEAGFEIVLASHGKAEITLTQRDIREVQLAKGAIAAGIDILLKENDLKAADISKVVLAGAFGQFIRKEMAVRIGLLPDVPLERVVFIGNAACAGAELALLSRSARRRAEALSKQVEYVEIAAKPEFQDIFTEKVMLG